MKDAVQIRFEVQAVTCFHPIKSFHDRPVPEDHIFRQDIVKAHLPAVFTAQVMEARADEPHGPYGERVQ